MSGAATDLYDTASALLDFCTVALDELPWKAPDRRFVSIGYPPVDCTLLSTFFFPAAPGPFAPSDAPGDFLRQGHPYVTLEMITLHVQVHRCWPSTPEGQSPKAPKPVDYDYASSVLMTDGWQLYNAIREGIRQGLFGGPCKLARVDSLTPIQPQGGYAGIELLCTAQLDGYDPELPEPEA